MDIIWISNLQGAKYLILLKLKDTKTQNINNLKQKMFIFFNL